MSKKANDINIHKWKKPKNPYKAKEAEINGPPIKALSHGEAHVIQRILYKKFFKDK